MSRPHYTYLFEERTKKSLDRLLDCAGLFNTAVGNLEHELYTSLWFSDTPKVYNTLLEQNLRVLQYRGYLNENCKKFKPYFIITNLGREEQEKYGLDYLCDYLKYPLNNIGSDLVSISRELNVSAFEIGLAILDSDNRSKMTMDLISPNLSERVIAEWCLKELKLVNNNYRGY